MRGVVRMMVMMVVTGYGVWGAADMEDNVEELEECCEPRHVHLSLGEAPDQIQVMWATRSPCHTVKVTYGTSPWRLQASEVTGSSVNLTGDVFDTVYSVHHVHRATLSGLQEGVTYFYRPVCNRIGAGPFYFHSPYTNTAWSPRVMVTGDLGAGSQLLPLISRGTLSGQYSATLQLGALTTYLADSNGTRGDHIMQALQQTAAFLPFMTATGDYEREEGPPYPVYSQLFSMPGSPWPRTESSPLWYSFHLGPVHFISISTAVYLHDGDKALQQQQLQWLTKNLEQANKDRGSRPWIVVFGRHPLYCSDQEHTSHSDHCDHSHALVAAGLEDLFYNQGVDLILQSHDGGYRRLYPLYKELPLSANYTNPPSPVHIILGAASSPSLPSPSLTTPATPGIPPGKGVGWGANVSDSNNSGVGGGDGGNSSASDAGNEGVKLAAVDMVNATDAAYGRLHVINATHAQWELLSGRAGEREEEVLDTVWLVQEKHGPFHLSDLPKDVEDKIEPHLETGEGSGGSKPSILNTQEEGPDSRPHPHPLGDILHAVDTHRRLVVGISLGAAALVMAVLLIACRLRRRRRRGGPRRGMVPRRWDTTDYKYGKTRLSNDLDDEDDDDDFKDGNGEVEGSTDDRLQTKRLITRS